jgi:hypothetical protein
MNDAQARRLGYRDAAALERQGQRQASDEALARRVGADVGADRFKTETRLFDERLDARFAELDRLHPRPVPTNADIDRETARLDALRPRAKAPMASPRAGRTAAAPRLRSSATKLPLFDTEAIRRDFDVLARQQSARGRHPDGRPVTDAEIAGASGWRLNPR